MAQLVPISRVNRKFLLPASSCFSGLCLCERHRIVSEPMPEGVNKTPIPPARGPEISEQTPFLLFLGVVEEDEKDGSVCLRSA